MEPRQLWDRHAVLAEAFCGTDERVRVSQSVLDEAQAERSQTLAAFAVTVGDDDAVAQMLGLTEREVRLARRTVGKEAARTCAETLLAATDDTSDPHPVEPPSESPPQPPHAVHQPGTHHAAAMPAQQVWPPSHQPSAPGPGAAVAPPSWSPAMDALLVGAWQNQLDPTVLAAELGLDLASLAARAQHLTAEGRLRPPSPYDDQAGRHRRGAATAPQPEQYAPPSSGHTHNPPVQGPSPDVHAWQQWQWQQHTEPAWEPHATTATTRDWEGILDQWQSAQHTAM